MRARLTAFGPVLVPGLLAVALLVAWAFASGGYPPRAGTDSSFEPDAWYLGALAAVGLLGAGVAGIGAARIRVSRIATLALGAFALYVLVAYASIAWAQVPGDALDGANRALVYFAFFALFALLPWRATSAQAALAVFAVGGGVVALVTAFRLGSAPHPSAGFYHDGRLASPLSYQNATAAFFTMIVLTGIGVGARRNLHFAARGAALASAGLALELAVMAQSRGWLFTLPFVAVAAIVLVPDRVRFALFALGPVLVTLAILDPLLAVYRAAGYHGRVRPASEIDQLLATKGASASSAIVIATLVLFALGSLAAWLDARRTVPPRVAKGANRAAAVAVVLIVLGGAGAGVAAVHGHVGQKVSSAWKSFKSTDTDYATSSRFTQFGSARYDFWRVGLDVFAEHPVGGIGQDNFAEAYAQRRRTGEETRWTHSLEVRLLVHTGVVGALAFVVFVAAALAAALRGRGPRRRRDTPPGEDDERGRARRSAAAIALLPLCVWLIHGSIDWLWEFPVLSGAALGFMGMATSLARPRGETVAGRVGAVRAPSRRRSRLTGAAAALAGMIAVLVLAVSYVGERDVTSALRSADDDPGKAYAALGRAADLEPLNAQPPLLAGLVAWRARRPDLARERLEESNKRNGDQWLPPFLLGILASSRHDAAGAKAELARAHALSPSDALITEAVSRAGSARPMTLQQAISGLSDRYHRLFPR